MEFVSTDISPIEVSWGETHETILKNVKIEIMSVPSVHWSCSNAFNRNCSQWCGWACRIQNKTDCKSVYYAGDTAFSSQLFKNLGELLGPFDLSILPIGAYLPRSWLSSTHISPQEAVKIHRLIRSTKTIGCHHSTFRLSHTCLEVEKILNDLLSAMNENELLKSEFLLLPMGGVANW